MKYYDIPVIVVATKADKIPRGKWNKHESVVKKALNFDKSDTFIVFSSVERIGIDDSWDAIFRAGLAIGVDLSMLKHSQ